MVGRMLFPGWRGTGQRQAGFTIVELLIVVVIISIVAAISIATYTGIQVRARDSMRTDAIAKIKKSLELYKIDNGRYPSATPNPGCCGGWELSSDADGTFIESLRDYGLAGGVPVDPINNAAYTFFYYRYPAGSGGCDPVKGGFYVLSASYESAAKPQGNSMTTECSSPQSGWSDAEGWYSFHAYENE